VGIFILRKNGRAQNPRIENCGVVSDFRFQISDFRPKKQNGAESTGKSTAAAAKTLDCEPIGHFCGEAPRQEGSG